MKVLIAVSVSGIKQSDHLMHMVKEDPKNIAIISYGSKSSATNDDRSAIINMTTNKNVLRSMALASPAEWVLFLDDSVYLPKGSIEKFLKEGKEIMGGWYQSSGAVVWSTLSENKEGRFEFFTKPEKGTAEVGALGLGCLMVHRPTLMKIAFEPGFEHVSLIDGMKQKDGPFPHMGDALAFAFSAKKIEEKIAMVGDVVCGPEMLAKEEKTK
ncbi:MAG: hypothetical protein PHN89_02155 [Candidatus Pacebacteria bacterium]|nr:hypothetical protein [Candidatus Paceibacterota bacterium]